MYSKTTHQNLLQSTPTFSQQYARLTEQLDAQIDNFQKRGYRTRVSESSVDRLFHITDGTGHHLGSASELNVKLDTKPELIASRTYLNRQLLLKQLSELSTRLQADGGDQINIKTMGLKAMGYTTQIKQYDNETLVEVFDSGNGVHKFHVDKKEILKGTENKAIAGWLTALTTDLIKQHPALSSKGVVNS